MVPTNPRKWLAVAREWQQAHRSLLFTMTEFPPVPGQLDLLQVLGTPTEPSAPAVDQIQSDPQSEPSDAPDLQKDQSAVVPCRDSGSEQGEAPEQLLIVDTETTGLHADTDHCLEVGAILFSVSSRQVLAQVSFLLPVESNPAEAINRIPASVTRMPQPWQQGLVYFQELMNSADLLVAHNASFDRQWFGRGVLPSASRPWLCTLEDVRWPSERQLRARPSVIDLALAYGVPVWSAHRALTDCLYLAEVFRRCDDLELLIARGLEPRCLMRAQVSYDDRHLAREAGFRWNDPVKGAWVRRLSEREAEGLAFPVVPVDNTMPMAS